MSSLSASQSSQRTRFDSSRQVGTIREGRFGGFSVAVTLEQFGLDRLAPEERLELLELLWDSLGECTFTLPE